MSIAWLWTSDILAVVRAQRSTSANRIVIQMTIDYLARRIGMFVAVIFVATSFNFFLPRFTGQDPIATRLAVAGS